MSLILIVEQPRGAVTRLLINMVAIDGDRILTQVDMKTCTVSVVILFVDYALLRLEKVKVESEERGPRPGMA
jgi:hypothetical protein